MYFRLSVTLKNRWWKQENMSFFFFLHCFQKPPFSSISTIETERFENDLISKGSTIDVVFESLRFHQRFVSFQSARQAKTQLKVCIFKRKCVNVVGTLILFFPCAFLITEAKVLNSRAMHIAADSEKKLLHRMFDYWVQEAHKVQKAKKYAREKVMRR